MMVVLETGFDLTAAVVEVETGHQAAGGRIWGALASRSNGYATRQLWEWMWQHIRRGRGELSYGGTWAGLRLVDDGGEVLVSWEVHDWQAPARMPVYRHRSHEVTVQSPQARRCRTMREPSRMWRVYLDREARIRAAAPVVAAVEPEPWAELEVPPPPQNNTPTGIF